MLNRNVQKYFTEWKVDTSPLWVWGCSPLKNKYIRPFFSFSFSWDKVSGSPGWPSILCMTKDDLELLVLLPLSTNKWSSSPLRVKYSNQEWWLLPAIPALKGERQEGCLEFKVSMDYSDRWAGLQNHNVSWINNVAGSSLTLKNTDDIFV